MGIFSLENQSDVENSKPKKQTNKQKSSATINNNLINKSK